MAFGTRVFAVQAFGGGPALSPSAFPMVEFLAVVSLDTYSFLRARVGFEVEGQGTPYLITYIGMWIALEEEEKLLSTNKI